jgi:hypothetical protein
MNAHAGALLAASASNMQGSLGEVPLPPKKCTRCASALSHDSTFFYVQGSVEERIMAVTNKRRNGNGSAIDAAALTELEYEGERGRVGRGRVRVEDLAGAIRADRQALRLSELDVLFQVFQLIQHI